MKEIDNPFDGEAHAAMQQPDVTEQDLSEAMDHTVSDYTAALEHANGPSQRLGAEIDLAYITGNWRGMPRKIDQLIATPGCISSNWVHTMVPSFGYAKAFLPKSTEDRMCDPLSTQTWFTETRMAYWSGDPESAENHSACQ